MVKAIYGVNLLLLLLILRYELKYDNDKTIIISSLSIVVMVTLNLIIGFISQMDHKSIYKHYYFAALALVFSMIILLSLA